MKQKNSYLTLVRAFPLLSIENDEQLEKAEKFLDKLLRLPLNEGGEAYVEALSDLIALYEIDKPPHARNDTVFRLLIRNPNEKN